MRKPILGILSMILAAPFVYAAGEQPIGSPKGQAAPQTTMPQAAATEWFSLDVKGMKSLADSAKIEQELKKNPAIVSSRCDQKGGLCHVEIDPSKLKREDVAVQINKLGFQAHLRPGL